MPMDLRWRAAQAGRDTTYLGRVEDGVRTHGPEAQ